MIVVTGATGNTGSKIIPHLLKKGEKVVAVGRSEKRLHDLFGTSVDFAVGDQCDLDFATRTFEGADAVYLLIPPKMDSEDVLAYYNSTGIVATAALKANGIGKVVFLSSLGAELSAGTGPVLGLHRVEEQLGKLSGTDIAILRPGYFMENSLMNIPFIKEKKMNGNNIDGTVAGCMIATKDIAAKAAELLISKSFSGHVVFDLFGDAISYGEVTRIIAQALGIADEVPYVRFSAQDTINNLTSFGISHNVASSFVELGDAISRRKIHPTTVDPARPNTPTRFTQFVKEVLGS